MHVEHIDARNGSKGRGYFDHDQVLELVGQALRRYAHSAPVRAAKAAAAGDASAAPVDNVRAYGLIEVDEVKGLAQACQRGTFNTLRDQCEQSPAKEDCLRHRVGTFCRGQYAGRD